MLPLAIAGAGIAAAGGIIGELLAGGKRAEAERLAQRAYEQYGSIEEPFLQQVMAEEQGATGLSDIQTDPRLEAAEYNALNKLQQIEDGGGTSLADQATLNRTMNRVNSNNRSTQESILGDMSSRGALGSGAELSARLKANQDSINANSQAGLDIVGQAQQRYLDSILGRGEMAGKMSDRQYGRKARAAEAQDMINRYNTGNRNQATYYNAGLPQQQFDNRLKIASGKANALGGQANTVNQSADRTAAVIGGVGQGIGEGMTAYANYRAQQEARQPGVYVDDDMQKRK
jgi:hypothetical protein